MKTLVSFIFVYFGMSVFGAIVAADSGWMATPERRIDYFGPPYGIYRSQNYYEVVPRSFFEEVIDVHEGGMKIPLDEKLSLRLNVKRVGLPVRVGEMSFTVGFSYVFDRGKELSPQQKVTVKEKPSLDKGAENDRFYSYLFPVPKEEKGLLTVVVLKYKRGTTALTPEHRKVLQGLLRYLSTRKDVKFILISGEGGPVFDRRREKLVRYLTREGSIKASLIKTEITDDVKGNPYVELRIEEV